ncbi:beta-propeller domain-containing protein [Sphingomonas sp.]|uniref:beta-propeller domain-containing protein n=1 Tax=Sphingomonas sp. TaxID=28214 RepID=UPI00286E1485|nr:beta-propeller domain-containing protein [Sphingomonas sp.]
MGRSKLWVAAVAALVVTGSAQLGRGSPAAAQAADSGVRAGGSLASFRSDRELRAFLEKRRETRQDSRGQSSVVYAPPPPAPPPPPAATAESSADAIVTTGSRVAKSDAITNNQEAGVDEGGIVKKRGDLLVILRRGRLFTVSTARGGMRPVDVIDAMPPGVDGSGDWYDEMLLHGDRVVVVGYSYRRGGTEINRFRLSPDGRLRFEDSYHLRSNDYYSSRNYASRLIGNRLIYYTPLALEWEDDPFEAFPAVRRWTGNNNEIDFRPIVDAREVFVVPEMRDDPEAPLDTLHSVMNCDLTAPVLDCDAIAVLGPASRTFYVSGNAVYLWVSDAWSGQAEGRGGVRSFAFRLPFGDEAPSAIAARGAPTDQFSFREDARAGLLDVLVRADGGGDAMWNPEATIGDVALLSIPIRWMGNGMREVPLNRYRPLPRPDEENWNFQNRFVGNHVLYGGGGIGSGDSARLVAAGLRGGPVAEIPLPHAVERIDILGGDGVVIGNDNRGGLNFTAIDLRRAFAAKGASFLMPNAAQGESRSHGFFYRADDPEGANGVLGLPIARAVDPGFHRFFGSAASLLFLRRDQRRLVMAGELGAQYRRAADDRCVASCVDWYGNARPIFAGDRIFALLGYELVEGRMARGAIHEIDRVDFAPGGRMWRQGRR